MASLLTSTGNTAKVVKYIASAGTWDTVLPPDERAIEFHADGEAIRSGLGAVKNLVRRRWNRSAARAWGRFVHYQFCDTVVDPTALNRRMIGI
jgi:DNA polymerase III alpha subunit